jgi:hypothetical protein
MVKSIKQFAPVVATLAMLAGLGGFAHLDMATVGVADFMKRSKAAIEALPLKLNTWEGQKLPLEAEARDLLQPNAESRIQYIIPRNHLDVSATYSVIQVTDSRFMTGHAPMNCYPNTGYATTMQADRVWHVGEFDIKGIEYTFKKVGANGQLEVLNVRNFFIFPDGHFGATLHDLDEAASNYRKLKYGDVQVQVVTPQLALTDKQRDEIFQNLVGSERSIEMIRILRSGIPK